MLKAYKYRIYPDENQKMMLAQAFGCARLLYNSLLGWWNDEYAAAKRENRHMEKLPLVTYFKKEYPFLKDVDSLALMNARRSFESALKNFFDSKKGKRSGRKSGFPKFKKQGKCSDSYTTNCQDGTVRIEGDRIKLPKVKWVDCHLHRAIPEDGKIVRATVTRNRAGNYHVSVLVDLPEREAPKREYNLSSLKVVGLDMSMSRFAVSSDAEDDAAKTKYVRLYRQAERRIARLSRTLHRREMKKDGDSGRRCPSKNREKARIRLAKANQKVANRRDDFTWKMAVHYARNYDVIVLEDIDMQLMARTLHLGKSVNDLGWGMFRQQRSWKCREYDSVLMYADRWFASSKTCSHCGNVNRDLKLSDREWTCPECGAVLDRDYNAACNLRDYFFRMMDLRNNNSTDGTAGIDACGDLSSTLRETLMQAGSAKQESSADDPEAPSCYRWG